MAIKYQWNCVYGGYELSSVYVRPDFIPDDIPDLYLLPSDGISCRGCRSIHFIRRSDRLIFQFNDRASGDALNYGFPLGTFQSLGVFQGEYLGQGTGTLTITQVVGDGTAEDEATKEAGCC